MIRPAWPAVTRWRARARAVSLGSGRSSSRARADKARVVRRRAAPASSTSSSSSTTVNRTRIPSRVNRAPARAERSARDGSRRARAATTGASSSHQERPNRRYASRDAMKREKAAGSSSCSMPASQPVPAPVTPFWRRRTDGSSSSPNVLGEGALPGVAGILETRTGRRGCDPARPGPAGPRPRSRSTARPPAPARRRSGPSSADRHVAGPRQPGVPVPGKHDHPPARSGRVGARRRAPAGGGRPGRLWDRRRSRRGCRRSPAPLDRWPPRPRQPARRWPPAGPSRGSGPRCRSAITTTRPPTGTCTASRSGMSLEAANAAPDATTVRLDGTRTGAGRSDAPEVLEMARRLGPLPYSAPGPQPRSGAARPVGAGGLAGGRGRRLVGRSRAPRSVHPGRDRSGRRHPGGGVPGRGSGVPDRPALRARRRRPGQPRSGNGSTSRSNRPILVLGPVGPDDQEDFDEPTIPAVWTEERIRAVAGIGPLITSLAEPPVVEGPAVVLAIGWASRLPSDRLEWRDGRWWEIRSAAGSRADAVCRAAGPARPVPAPPRPNAGRRRGLPRPDGARYAQLGPVQDWLARTLRVAESGRLVVIDRWTDVDPPAGARGGTAPGPRPAGRGTKADRRRARSIFFPISSMVSWRLG